MGTGEVYSEIVNHVNCIFFRVMIIYEFDSSYLINISQSY